MRNRQFKSEEKESEFDIFEIYNNKVDIIGFRTSWISEFKEEMKNTYEGDSLEREIKNKNND